ncbi:hypothetical protein CYMTET_33893 [Cymbomonas tetramitiformis]|uniref:HTH CENPB-type domain-containing protein n=1 Tax=Cymbomonas tetramitiformis TaxID=36881 RepID=A0AAE0FC76_9CHLO|nr:hypothetical protein CYMTET_33893 [Cymbomonas tetramitiformis]
MHLRVLPVHDLSPSSLSSAYQVQASKRVREHPVIQQSAAELSTDSVLLREPIELGNASDIDWRVKPLFTITTWGRVQVKLDVRRAKRAGGATHRQPHSLLKKLRVVSRAKRYKEEHHSHPISAAAFISQVDVSLVSRWLAKEDGLLLRLQNVKNKPLGRGRYPKIEDRLLKDFHAARKKGLRIGRRWLKTKARIIAKKVYPGRYFRAASSWCTNWLRRNSLSCRKKTNKKSKSTEERLPKIRRWHARLRRRLQCLVRMIGLDEHRKHQQPRQTICFRGTGIRISSAERAAYDKRVRVVFQAKAYYNDEMCAEWATTDFNSQVDAVRRKVVFSDNLSGQTTEAWVNAKRLEREQHRQSPVAH